MSMITQEPEQAPSHITLDDYLRAYQSLYVTQTYYDNLPTDTRSILEDPGGPYKVTKREFSVIVEFAAPA